jgi:hypothetical protein
MNRPKDDTSPRARAIMPSNQSVSAAAMKSQNATVAAQPEFRSTFISQTMMNIAGTREMVIQLARVKRMDRSRNTRRTLGNPLLQMRGVFA